MLANEGFVTFLHPTEPNGIFGYKKYTANKTILVLLNPNSSNQKFSLEKSENYNILYSSNIVIEGTQVNIDPDGFGIIEYNV